MLNNKSLWYLALWAVFIFACAYMIPYFSNDYRYMLVEGNNAYVSSVADVFVSQYRHYFSWGGRTPAHIIAQLLLYWGKSVSAVMNTVCYMTVVLFIYYHAYGIRPTLKGLRFIPLVLITFGLWLCLRTYGEVVFMLVSSCNYLYTTAIILIFLLPFRLMFKDEKAEDSILFGIMMFFLGIIAGWTNENTGFAVCSMTGVLFIYNFIKHKLTFWQFAATLGLGIGYLILVLAPGNAARLAWMKSWGHFSYWAHITGGIGITGLTLLTQLPLFVTLLFFVRRITRSAYQIDLPWQWRAIGWYFLMAMLSLLIMIFSPNFPARSTAPFTIFLLTAMVCAYSILDIKAVKLLDRRYAAVLWSVGIVYVATTWATALYGYYTAYQDSKVRNAQIATQLAQGKKDLVVTPFHVRTSKYVFIGDIRAEKSNFADEIVARYYKINTIRRTCNYQFYKTAFDFLPYDLNIGKPVCEGDHGDPQDQNDPLTHEWLKIHPEDKSKLRPDLYPYIKGITPED
ncbi:MAG: hypothetical protein J6M93_01015 [Succinivibrio sp.]|nr:hypothetical protein [Succinivibrio sp.]